MSSTAGGRPREGEVEEGSEGGEPPFLSWSSEPGTSSDHSDFEEEEGSPTERAATDVAFGGAAEILDNERLEASPGSSEEEPSPRQQPPSSRSSLIAPLLRSQGRFLVGSSNDDHHPHQDDNENQVPGHRWLPKRVYAALTTETAGGSVAKNYLWAREVLGGGHGGGNKRAIGAPGIGKKTRTKNSSCGSFLSREQVIQRVAFDRVYKEEELNVFDKIFASAWLDENVVLCGTKCNKLLAWRTMENKMLEIPIPDAGSAPLGDQCGIHSISVNGSETLLVTGGRSAADACVFRLPDFTPLMMLKGHTDWIFATEFVNEELLLTASRDCTVSLWSTKQGRGSSPATLPMRKPLITRREHSQKVRALKYNKNKHTFATAGADGQTKIWDARNMDVISSISLIDTNEVVCLAVEPRHDLICVGSQQFATFIDARAGSIVHRIPSQDEDWGIRSLDFQCGSLLTIGGGMGRLSFYDLVAGAYRNRGDKPYLQTGNGWMLKDESFYAHFSGLQLYHAIYTHCYDPTKTKIFIGGGPIMHGLKGSYAAIW
ncbi:DDB1- and CUL4-associated factor 12 [Balamuthia mandrillaris]